KGSDGRWQIAPTRNECGVRVLSSRLELTCLDLIVKFNGFWRWLKSLFFRKHLAAAFILGHRRSALTAQGQEAHQLPVSFFTPGFQFNLTPSVSPREIK